MFISGDCLRPRKGFGSNGWMDDKASQRSKISQRNSLVNRNESEATLDNNTVQIRII